MGIKLSWRGLNGHDLFSKIISRENLFLAWHEFKREKLKKPDVLAFAFDLEKNIFALHQDLASGTYCHDGYLDFFVHDPKRRHIHKASVRDRLLHHAVFRILEPVFDPSFIFDSYSSRKTKGVHKAIARFEKLAWELSRNNTKTVWILKCDIRKFFDSVDHWILLTLLAKKIKDQKILELLKLIIGSYEVGTSKGIPLGNLTSQLFANVYLDCFDQFVKRKLRVKNYLRYADDFVIFLRQEHFANLIYALRDFLSQELKLELHPHKVLIAPWHAGVDFLGYVHFPFHRVLRTKTKKRMFKQLRKNNNLQNRAAYLALLKHCSGETLARQIKVL